MVTETRTYSDATRRWAGVGPYYAMFPSSFADRVINLYTEEGDMILDPFAGRGTSIYSAAVQKREAIGIEMNPVGFVYAQAKLNTADEDDVLRRLRAVARCAPHFAVQARALPEFFHWCFSRPVRRFLLAARANLDWRRNRTDHTLMALLLVYLHGKRYAALSNQMRQTKSMSPQYSIAWWRKRDQQPLDIDPVEFMTSRIEWRYAKGVPKPARSKVFLGDSVRILERLNGVRDAGDLQPAKLLFTSPPYHKVTNYHYDQWLRLWLLGGPANALRTGGARRGKFEHRQRYRMLLERVFSRAKPLLARNAVVYVRTDKREFTYNTTVDVLKYIFPAKRLCVTRRPFAGRTQTHLFGDTTEKDGEVDLILKPLGRRGTATRKS